MAELAGHVAIVTGAGRGLGRAVAERLAVMGAASANEMTACSAPTSSRSQRCAMPESPDHSARCSVLSSTIQASSGTPAW